jgi:hypothetical protein
MLPDILHLIDTLPLECRVTHGENLIDNQDLGLEMGRYGES